jgi:hypothetical protein
LFRGLHDTISLSLSRQSLFVSSGATFGEAAPAINAAAGMTFMTAACGIDELLTQFSIRRMRLTGERKHSTGEYASYRST